MYFDKDIFLNTATLQDIRLLSTRQIEELNGEKVILKNGKLQFEQNVQVHSLFQLKEEWCTDTVQNQLF